VADRSFRARFQSFWNWFTLRPILAAARAQLPRPGGRRAHAIEQVRLLREVVRQVENPAEELPPGRPSAVLLSLHRDLVFWTLVAERTDDGGAAGPDLKALWDQSPPDRLLRAAGSQDNLEALRSLLVDLPMLATLETGDAELARVHAFAESLYRDVEAPYRRVNQLLVRRWLHGAGVVIALGIVAFAIQILAAGPDLAKGKPFRASSMQPGCAEDESCAALMFHTTQEPNPWVEIDLGAVKPVRLVEVRNRVDCCQQRAVPLVAELSKDRKTWTEVARRDTDFSTWTANFPRTSARYVRLRAPRITMLHLEKVVVR